MHYQRAGRRRELRPDAIVSPKPSHHGKRVFIELDRSTEAIRHRDGQRSIERKLDAYARFFRLPVNGRQETWYEAAFSDARRAVLAFVLTKEDTRNSDPRFRNRRLASIGAIAKRHSFRDQCKVKCLYLADTAAVRNLAGSTERPRTRRTGLEVEQPGKPLITGDDLRELIKLFNAGKHAARRLEDGAPEKAEFNAVGESSRAILNRLRQEVSR